MHAERIYSRVLVGMPPVRPTWRRPVARVRCGECGKVKPASEIVDGVCGTCRRWVEGR